MDFLTILDLPFGFGLFVSSLAISPMAPSPDDTVLAEEVFIECTEVVLDFVVGGVPKTTVSENCTAGQ
ncbi:MAG: hypothetical protein ABJF89_07045 [Parasphingorhabdus sp.]|uniref:hypothetical protein n=1 Tax=Parasphingorhabdus sp. TaxID=2709688 RepID=UPI0032671735